MSLQSWVLCAGDDNLNLSQESLTATSTIEMLRNLPDTDPAMAAELHCEQHVDESDGELEDYAADQQLGPSGAIVNGRLHYVGYDASTEYVYNPEHNATEDDVYRVTIGSRASKAGQNLSPEDLPLLGMACLTL
ncbi:MAG: hypothetical protein CYPHOPRED_005934 [Cyphobasidiales sp. Tagirdzhanova-0007]|nr:MAG: hypothetical protein CYPHOPRED_005934 [Cyphobasidiales sp. Tagirdzhanova-0007]